MTTPIRRRSASAIAVLVGLVLVVGVAGDQRAQAREDDEARCGEIPALPPPTSDWPRIRSEIRRDPFTEAIVADMVSRMTLAEKVGQMTQAEIQSITPAEVRQYHIGSVLNGGGSWPNNDKHATPSAWLALADAYWDAALPADGAVNAQEDHGQREDGQHGEGVAIPIMWGIDAVHGNSNVFGATLFPHNIGLGAARDPCLVRRIARATAEQVRVTGQDWAFAPTLAVVRDDRWGRTYEGFSEDPAITRAYAAAYVDGLQGGGEGEGEDRSVRRLRGVLATAKHFIGDGGTAQGRDQGVNPSPEAILREIHGQGYFGALGAGAQTVMISFSSWTNEQLGIREGKVHGSRYLITDVLKGKMGFDGLVVSDWNGIGQVAGCSNFRCAQALNAGIDVFMVPAEWRQFIANTIQLVQSGAVPMSRIDDAVTRILRVKLRAGLFGARRPSERRLAGDAGALVQRELAKEAVQRSAVLLKNNRNVLPLARNRKILVVGKGANDFSIQTGGWTLSWQGTGNTKADFPNGETVLAGIRRVAGDANVTFGETPESIDSFPFGPNSAVIAVIGETPYAEGVGDIGRTRTLEHAARYPSDLAVLKRVAGRGAPVVTIFFSGRPAYVNKELNRSDAFVAAFLPGTEAGSIADLLFRDARGGIGRGFTGKLSYSWPAAACQTPLNIGDKPYDPLFDYGFGLGYRDQVTLRELDETSPAIGCGQTGGGGTATEDLNIFVRGNVEPYRLYIGAPVNWGGVAVSEDPKVVTTLGGISVQTAEVNVQEDGRRVTWTGTGQIYSQSSATADLRGYLNAKGALVLDVIVGQSPAGSVKMRVDCVWPCLGEVDATRLFRSLTTGVRHTVKIPLQCFSAAGTDMGIVNTPLLFYTERAFQLSFANVRWVPGAGDGDATACDAL
jgi:beta-glucosidase